MPYNWPKHSGFEQASEGDTSRWRPKLEQISRTCYYRKKNPLNNNSHFIYQVLTGFCISNKCAWSKIQQNIWRLSSSIVLQSRTMHITGGVRGTPKMRDANSEYSGGCCLSQPQKCAAITTQQWLMARGSEHCVWQHLARTNNTITSLLVSLCLIIPAWSLEGETWNCARLFSCRFSLFCKMSVRGSNEKLPQFKVLTTSSV